MPLRLLAFIFSWFFISSCSIADAPPVQEKAEGGTYFSIKGFIKDQWNTYSGQPFTFVKTVTLNGERDSSFVPGSDMEWGPLFKTFFDTDISDPKFLGQYDFTMFEDNATFTRNFYYEAKNEKLFTRKLQISADLENNKIRSVFVETADNERWHSKSRKLFYIPLKVISIQEYEKATPGPDKDLRIEYRFM